MSRDGNRDPPRPKAPRKAVALHYGGKTAPRITASGAGPVADRILEIAREHDVPVHDDPLLTAALAQVPVGDEIPENVYVAVAEILAFIYLLSGRVPNRDPAPADPPATDPRPGPRTGRDRP